MVAASKTSARWSSTWAPLISGAFRVSGPGFAASVGATGWNSRLRLKMIFQGEVRASWTFSAHAFFINVQGVSFQVFHYRTLPPGLARFHARKTCIRPYIDAGP